MITVLLQLQLQQQLSQPRHVLSQPQPLLPSNALLLRHQLSPANTSIVSTADTYNTHKHTTMRTLASASRLATSSASALAAAAARARSSAASRSAFSAASARLRCASASSCNTMPTHTSSSSSSSLSSSSRYTRHSPLLLWPLLPARRLPPPNDVLRPHVALWSPNVSLPIQPIHNRHTNTAQNQHVASNI